MSIGVAKPRLMDFRRLVRSQRFKEAVIGVLFALPWLIRLFAMHLYPIISAFRYSLAQYSIISPPKWIGLDNYVKLFTKDTLPMKALGNSVFYSLGAVPLDLAMALTLAILLNQKIRFRSIYRVVFFIPSVVPGIASAVLWLWMLNPRVGLINFALTSIGLPRVPWTTSALWYKPAFILMSMWGIGYSTIIFLAGLQDIPRHLYEAAEIDGAGALQRFRTVTIPLLTPTIFFNLVMGIIGSLQIFGAAYIINNGPQGGPQNSGLFYVLYLFQQAFAFVNMGYASAMAMVLFVLILALTLMVFRSSQLWVYYETEVRK